MNEILRKAVVATLVMVSCVTGVAQNSHVDVQKRRMAENGKIIFIDGRPDSASLSHYVDSVRHEIETFYYDQFRQFNDPGAPYFMFMSKDANMALGIGGVVRMRAWYDWDGAILVSGFAPYLIPMHPSPTDMRHFGTTPAGTCIYMRAIGRNRVFGRYNIYIEANFNGWQGRDFHLKKAYAQFRDWTVGYAPSTFSNPQALAPTVDAKGHLDKLAAVNVLVRYMPQIARGWHIGVSVESPDTDTMAATDSLSRKLSTWLPDFDALVQYEWARGQHVRLAGMVRSLGYRNLVEQKNHYAAGWGVQLSSVTHPAAPFTTYQTLCYGRGIADMTGDMQMGSYDMVPDPAVPGAMYVPRILGWSLGLQYNIRPELFVSVSTSMMRYYPRGKVAPDEYKYGQFACANVFWSPTPRSQVGLEYDWGRRRNFSGDERCAHRIGAFCQFSF